MSKFYKNIVNTIIILILASFYGCVTQPDTGSSESNEILGTTNQDAIYGNDDRQKANIIQIDYDGFTVWLDCEHRGATKFRYNAQRDNGNFKRSSSFYIDHNIPRECQQTSTHAYSKGYDRGHLVPANHMDFSAQAIKQSNYMTNVLPQAKKMNRGAWLKTEEIIECYRDIDELLVIGGVIWGDDVSNDHFIKSHSIQTPDKFWKVIIRGSGQDERAIAWLIPNSAKAKHRRLDDYLISVSDLEKVTGETIPIADYAKHDKLNTSWIIPTGCDRS